jgi:G3E family GTPase
LGKIPFHIISGFLGSGKTTFLKRIIDIYASGIRIGIIQNEFAPVNIDGAELNKNGGNFKLLEISNGSVFCVCLLGSFARSLEKFIDDYEPEMLVIEASGLSDTTSVVEVISSGKLSQKIFLASNWCLVDSLNFSKVGLMKQRVIHQIRMADFVVINKVDLSGNEEILKIAEEVKRLNPFAEIIRSEYCNFSFSLGEKSINKIYFGEMIPLSRPAVNSMVIKTSRKISIQSLSEFLNNWAVKAYRIKGFVNLNDGTTVAVHCTFDTIEIKPTEIALTQTELIALTDQFTLHEWNRAYKEQKAY